MVAAERLALRGEEDRQVVGLKGDLRPRLAEVLPEPGHGALADGHIAVFPALALAHHDQPASRSRS